LNVNNFQDFKFAWNKKSISGIIRAYVPGAEVPKAGF